MNRIFFEEVQRIYSIGTGDTRFEHARRTLKAQKGDRMAVGVINGPLGWATVTKADSEGILLAPEWDSNKPETPPSINAIVGICRPAAVNRILRELAPLGIQRLIFSVCEKSGIGYASSKSMDPTGWRSRLVEGMEQAFVVSQLPEVVKTDTLAAAVHRWNSASSKWFLDVYETDTEFGQGLTPIEEELTVAIGPERGWGPHDRKLLREAGFQARHLGKRILRVDTALIAFASRVQLLRSTTARQN